MRQLNLTVQEFSRELENKLPENRYSKVCTSFGLVDPTQFSEKVQNGYLYKFKLKGYNARQCKLLALGSWYLNNHFGTILRADLRTKIEQGSFDTKVRLELLPYLESKSHAVSFLVTVDDKISANDWYGNIFSELESLLSSVELLLFKPTKKFVKKYSGYCRGYKSSKPGKTIEKQVLKNDIFMNSWECLKSSDEIVTLLHQHAMSFYIERDFENYKKILETLQKFSLERRTLLNFFDLSGSEALERLREFEKFANICKKTVFDDRV